jgi:tetratricopeptide (TPR) repeat protein
MPLDWLAILGTVGYDLAKAGLARASRKDPDDLLRRLFAALDRATASFFQEFGSKFPSESRTFIARSENVTAVAEMLQDDRPMLTASRLNPRGVAGGPDATEAEVERFIELLKLVIGADLGLSRHIRTGEEQREGREFRAETRTKLQDLQDGFARMAAEQKGVPLPVLRSVLRRMGEIDVPDEKIEDLLFEKAEEIRRLREQLARPSVSVTESRAVSVQTEVLRLIDEGDLDAARRQFRLARDQIRGEREQRAREEAAFISGEARIDSLELRYRAAAEKFAEAAQIVSFDRSEQVRYVLGRIEALEAAGVELGDPEAHAAADEEWERLLSATDRSANPRGWAVVQLGRAANLVKRGAREVDSTKLENALHALTAGLEVVSREADSGLWVRLQEQLGLTLVTLGERVGDAGHLEQGVAALREAVNAWPPTSDEMSRVNARTELADALLSLGDRRRGTDEMEEAIWTCPR